MSLRFLCKNARKIKCMIHQAGALAQIQHSYKSARDIILGPLDGIGQAIAFGEIGSDRA